ncbi:hypothetical protein HAX54_008925 [Datura stramonium]|uniref:Amine oxidase domain-containing protein n=1 Tax=Datura stramonium TaxID=4076 RepID=A0ABS8TFP4_DATST|nr:hypothetical protein [Datura stramonium]
MKVAVVGAGLSGLVSAYELAKAGVKVVIYEKEDYLGGHVTKTLTVDGVDLALGFMIFDRSQHSSSVMWEENAGNLEDLGHRSSANATDKHTLQMNSFGVKFAIRGKS